MNSKENVLGIYPLAKIEFNDRVNLFYVEIADKFTYKILGVGKTQKIAWDNSWKILSAYLMWKLES